MISSITYRASPPVHTGDRSLFVITRQTAASWESGCFGNSSPVAIVVLEDGAASVWRLDKTITDGDVCRIIRDVFSPAQHP